MTAIWALGHSFIGKKSILSGPSLSIWPLIQKPKRCNELHYWACWNTTCDRLSINEAHISVVMEAALITQIYSQWSNYAVAHGPCGLFSAWINMGLRQWATLWPPEGPQRLMLVIMPQLLFVCTYKSPKQKLVWHKSDSCLGYCEDSCRWVCRSFTKRLTLEFPQIDQSMVPDNPGRNRDLQTSKWMFWLQSLWKWNLYSLICSCHSLENFRSQHCKWKPTIFTCLVQSIKNLKSLA